MARGKICPQDCTCGRHKNKGVAGPATLRKDGYLILSAQYAHPLADKRGLLLEHRKVLYNKIGPGPHDCFWCLRPGLVWVGRGPDAIHVDHLDDDRGNNDPENLAPSCYRCNMNRHRKRSLLTASDVVAVRELYKAGKLTQEAVGEIFGVSGATINRIINNKLWWSGDGNG